MASIKLGEVEELINRLNSLMKKAGPSVHMVGSIKIEELGIDLGFNNRDCDGACSTSCSGCSACSGCSGCSSTSTVKAFDPGAVVSNPNPLDRFVSSLSDPTVREALVQAARAAKGG